MGLFELKIILVVILCVPIVVLGFKLIGSLMDAAIMGKKKGKGNRQDKRGSDE